MYALAKEVSEELWYQTNKPEFMEPSYWSPKIEQAEPFDSSELPDSVKRSMERGGPKMRMVPLPTDAAYKKARSIVLIKRNLRDLGKAQEVISELYVGHGVEASEQKELLAEVESMIVDAESRMQEVLCE